MKEWINLKSIPKISFAHIYTTSDKYINHLPINPNFFEFSYTKVGNLTLEQGKDILKSTAETVSFQVRNEAVDVVSDGLLEIHCIGFYVEFESYFPKQTIKIPNTDGKNGKIMHLIDEIIATHNLSPDNITKKNALIFELVLEFNNRYNEYICSDNSVSGEISYVNKIKRYVIKNAHKKISLTEIANHLHISLSYLCIIFKKVTGESLVTYINKYKISVMKNLIISQNLSLKEASALVGITDTAYASRLFKKHECQTLKEFKCSVINKPF